MANSIGDMEILSIPWPYWLMAIIAVVIGVLTVRSTGDSLCLGDCPHCGEPLSTNREICEACSAAVAEREKVSL
jgi:hypothetical protein